MIYSSTILSGLLKIYSLFIALEVERRPLLWDALQHLLATKLVLSLKFASNGITSLLLSIGGTLHSKFFILLNIIENSSYHICQSIKIKLWSHHLHHLGWSSSDTNALLWGIKYKFEKHNEPDKYNQWTISIGMGWEIATLVYV